MENPIPEIKGLPKKIPKKPSFYKRTASALVIAASASFAPDSSQTTPTTPPNPPGIVDSQNSDHLSPSFEGHKISQIQHETVGMSKLASAPEPPKRITTIDDITNAMEKYRGSVFKEIDFESLKMYYPIYKAVGEKFGIDPKILMIFHWDETTFSTNPLTGVKRVVRNYDEKGNIILENEGIYGAMQIDQGFYNEQFIKRAFEGLEYLRQIKTRQPDDAEQIAGAGAILSRHLQTTKGDVLAAFMKYSNQQSAEKRWKIHNLYSEILPGF